MRTDLEAIRTRVDHAARAMAAGDGVIVTDDHDRENEGDFVFAGSCATQELVAFAMAECRGLLCVPMEGEALDRLGLGQMTTHNTDRMGTAFTVSVDARDGGTTGISAADRARTIRLLADPATDAEHLNRPGHVFPLRAKPGGVLRRAGHTEAAVDLARLAGLPPTGVICEIIKTDGTMARQPDLVRFASRFGLPMVSIADLIAYRLHTERQVEQIGRARMPTRSGTFEAVGYVSILDRVEHIALVFGEIGHGEDVLVRVHSECLTGDVFGSLRCDCGPQLDAALSAVAREGRGVVLYVRGHEGRGIGLIRKLQSYALQDAGADTVDANVALGLPVDARDYGTGAQILVDLGIRSMRLLTNNPDKRAGLEGFNLSVLGRVPLPVHPNAENLRYLLTKRDRMGHELPGLDGVGGAFGVGAEPA